MVRLFHSIWSGPQDQQRWGYEQKLRTYADILCAATSVAFAKKNGCEIVLHTDKVGKERFGFIPYDEVHLTLNNHPFDTAFWASGKVIAQAAEPLGSISIDPDVFIKTPQCVEELEELANYDLITQNEEFNYQDSYNIHSWAGVVRNIGSKGIAEVPAYDVRKCDAYCCGLVGFNNQKLKDMYIDGYKRLYDKLMSIPEFQEERFNFCPDLIIEQGFLRCCTKYLKSKVKNLLQDNHQTLAIEIGYTHVINVTKYQEDNIAKIEELLKGLSAELSEKVIEIKQKILTNDENKES